MELIKKLDKQSICQACRYLIQYKLHSPEENKRTCIKLPELRPEMNRMMECPLFEYKVGAENFVLDTTIMADKLAIEYIQEKYPRLEREEYEKLYSMARQIVCMKARESVKIEE